MVIYLLIIIVLIIWCCDVKEGFSTKKEKMGSISQWFKNNPNPTYTQYKQDFPTGTNVVEYEDALRLHQTGEVHKLIDYL